MAAGVVHHHAPQYVEVLVGMLAAALTHAVLTSVTGRSGDRGPGVQAGPAGRT